MVCSKRQLQWTQSIVKGHVLWTEFPWRRKWIHIVARTEGKISKQTKLPANKRLWGRPNTALTCSTQMYNSMLKFSVHKFPAPPKKSSPKTFLHSFKWGHGFSVGKDHAWRIPLSNLHALETGWPSTHLDPRNILTSQDNQVLSRKPKSISRPISTLLWIAKSVKLQYLFLGLFYGLKYTPKATPTVTFTLSTENKH